MEAYKKTKKNDNSIQKSVIIDQLKNDYKMYINYDDINEGITNWNAKEKDKSIFVSTAINQIQVECQSWW